MALKKNEYYALRNDHGYFRKLFITKWQCDKYRSDMLFDSDKFRVVKVKVTEVKNGTKRH